jgi:hypothetical protein
MGNRGHPMAHDCFHGSLHPRANRRQKKKLRLGDLGPRTCLLGADIWRASVMASPETRARLQRGDVNTPCSVQLANKMATPRNVVYPSTSPCLMLPVQGYLAETVGDACGCYVTSGKAMAKLEAMLHVIPSRSSILFSCHYFICCRLKCRLETAYKWLAGGSRHDLGVLTTYYYSTFRCTPGPGARCP